jgi:nicotinate phosphoribosyltransferase
VYKLVEYGGRPVAKLSTGKVTLPGPKQVFRGGDPDRDLIGTRDEPAPDGSRPLLAPVIERGRRLTAGGSLHEARARFDEDLAALPAEARELANPRAPSPGTTGALTELARRVHAQLREDASSRPASR